LTKNAWLSTDYVGTRDAQADIIGRLNDVKMTTYNVGPYSAAYWAQTRM